MIIVWTTNALHKYYSIPYIDIAYSNTFPLYPYRYKFISDDDGLSIEGDSRSLSMVGSDEDKSFISKNRGLTIVGKSKTKSF